MFLRARKKSKIQKKVGPMSILESRVFGAMQNRQIPDETITSKLICVILVGIVKLTVLLPKFKVHVFYKDHKN